MKIFSFSQIKDWDNFTIQSGRLNSLLLMENAARALTDQLVKLIPEDETIHIVCGKGNNGGDGLATAVLLRDRFYNPIVYTDQSKNGSEENDYYYKMVRKKSNIEIRSLDDFVKEKLTSGVILDALFGIGLKSEPKGKLRKIIEKINDCPIPVFSIDIPSGISDSVYSKIAVKADHTFVFQSVKECLLWSETGAYAGDFTVVNIGLNSTYYNNTTTNTYYITDQLIKNLIQKRTKFSHKGNYGITTIVGGSANMIGANVLCTKAALRSGCGLVKTHVPNSGVLALQISCPEAIVIGDVDTSNITNVDIDPQTTSIVIGCGLSNDIKTTKWLVDLLVKGTDPMMVLDADALNIIAEIEKIPLIPKGAIITPHPKEFDRLFGKHESSKDRTQTQLEKSKQLGIFIILKGAHTSISTPEGVLYYNSTGNAGMAKGGSGDVLAGLVGGLLARGYIAETSCLLATYWHGLAGDMAAAKHSEESMTSMDIAESLGESYKTMMKSD